MIDFEKLYILWYSRVKAFALEYVLHEEDAENIVQDVFADLYEKRHLLKEGKNVTAYLFTSIKNKAFLFLKEKKKTRHYINELSDAQRLESEMNLYVLAQMDCDFESENALDQALNKAIQKLPEQCRKIFILNKFKHIKHSKKSRRKVIIWSCTVIIKLIKIRSIRLKTVI